MEGHEDNSVERSRQLTVVGNIASSLEVGGGLRRRGAPRRVFTPRVISMVRGLAAHGKSASQIAKVIGSTPESVRVRCWQLKIKLRRQYERLQIERRKLVIYLHDADYAALNRKAAHMQKSAVELSADLLEAIIASNIYEAVLDDNGS